MLTRKEKRARKHRNKWLGIRRNGDWARRQCRKVRKRRELANRRVKAMLEIIFAD